MDSQITDKDRVPEALKDRVREALEDPKYQWRTISGIVSETGLTYEDVYKVLLDIRQEIVKSSAVSDKGEELYTTRKHFNQQATLLQKLRGAFRNRLD